MYNAGGAEAGNISSLRDAHSGCWSRSQTRLVGLPRGYCTFAQHK